MIYISVTRAKLTVEQQVDVTLLALDDADKLVDAFLAADIGLDSLDRPLAFGRTGDLVGVVTDDLLQRLEATSHYVHFTAVGSERDGAHETQTSPASSDCLVS
jgi:hypothetical protein